MRMGTLTAVTNMHHMAVGVKTCRCVIIVDGKSKREERIVRIARRSKNGKQVRRKAPQKTS